MCRGVSFGAPAVRSRAGSGHARGERHHLVRTAHGGTVKPSAEWTTELPAVTVEFEPSRAARTTRTAPATADKAVDRDAWG